MDQILFTIILFAVFFGLLRFVAKAIAWGVLLLVILPALAGMQFDVDWRRALDRVLFIVGAETKSDLSDDIRATLVHAPDRCGASQPLRFEVHNASRRDIGYVAYRLKVRPQDRSTERAFRDGTSDYIIKAGATEGFCLEIPAGASSRDVYRADLQRVEFMEG